MNKLVYREVKNKCSYILFKSKPSEGYIQKNAGSYEEKWWNPMTW